MKELLFRSNPGAELIVTGLLSGCPIESTVSRLLGSKRSDGFSTAVLEETGGGHGDSKTF